MVMEIVGEWHRELNKISKINILLKNNDDLLFNFDMDINEEKVLIQYLKRSVTQI